MEERVSVIIPTYNRSKWLPDAIESVLIQTYPDIEIIVVNDGSNDNTEQILKPYLDKIRYIYKENGGPGSAVNSGIIASTGKYISRLDDDDLLVPEKIESQVRVFQENPEFGLVASDAYIMDPDGHIVCIREVVDFSKHGAFLSLLQRCIFTQPTVMVQKACHERVGLYRDTYAQDYDMWIRISRHYPAGVIHKPLAVYRRHGENRSGKLSGGKVKADIQSFICEMLDSLTMEDLFGRDHSETYAHDVKGAIFMRHGDYRRAGLEFHEAIKAESNGIVHIFWSGILLRRISRYQNAYDCFRSIPPGSTLYEDAMKAIELTTRVQNIEREFEENLGRPELDEDDENLIQLRQDVSTEYNKLMDMTISMTKGQL